MKSQERKLALGAIIKNIRIKRKLSLRGLAAIADMEHSHVNLIEKGETSPSVIVLQSISEALQVSPSIFFNQEDAETIDFNSKLISKVKSMRLDRKISSFELSERIGCKNDLVRDFEDGIISGTYTAKQIVTIANVFNCRMSELLSK